VTRDRLPIEAQYVIRYHSFYPLHREHEYLWMLNDQDRRMLKWVKAFNPFDLYSKGDAKPDAEKELPFYWDLVEEFLPGKLRW
jgi:inositol oxygenase